MSRERVNQQILALERRVEELERVIEDIRVRLNYTSDVPGDRICSRIQELLDREQAFLAIQALAKRT